MLAALGVLAAVSQPAQADTGRITVRVLHETAPIRGATVESGEAQATTDPHGEAVLVLESGSREIRIGRSGFGGVTVPVEVQAGGNAPLVVQLQEESLESGAIVVTATRSGAVVGEQPIRVEAVPEEEIEENLTVQPGNLSTLLTEIAGVRMESTAPGLGGATLSIRGLPGRLTQVLSDGLPLIGAEPAGFGLLQTPPLDLGRVEIIKGVASALYGGSALGGVLNLVSRRPGGEPELLLSRTSLGGSDAVGFASAALAHGWGITATGGASLQERRDLDSDGWLDLPGYRRYTLRPRLFYDDGAGRTLFVTAGVLDEDRDGGSRPLSALPDGSTFTDALRTRRLDGGAVGRVALADGRIWSARLSATSSAHRRKFGDDLVDDRQSTQFAETTLSGHWLGHSWVAGAAIERDRLHSGDAPGVGYSHVVPAVFAQDEYAIGDRLVIAGSGRIDWHSDYGTFFSPRLSAVVFPADHWSLRASIGGGFAAPTPFVDEIESVGLGRLVPLGGLQAERARSASLDLQWAAASWEADFSLFGSDIRRPLAVRDAARPGWLELVNLDGTRRALGAEAFLRYSAEPMHVIGSYTRLDVTEPLAGGGRHTADRVPRSVAELAFLLEDEERGRAGIEIAYTGRQALADNPYRVASPGFFELNALAELKFGETAVFLNAINLTGVRQGDYDPLLLPAPGAGGSRITELWAPIAGRVYNLGVRLEF
jgi:iron complex outermembrane receptor protein